ncbi:MAG: hypothetical protein ACR2PA_23095 [Hyphomicrobiaceae bacterium]
MNSHVADDFHAALLALQDIESESRTEKPVEHETAQLVDEVFAFLDAFGAADEDAFASFEKIAA